MGGQPSKEEEERKEQEELERKKARKEAKYKKKIAAQREAEEEKERVRAEKKAAKLAEKKAAKAEAKRQEAEAKAAEQEQEQQQAKKKKKKKKKKGGAGGQQNQQRAEEPKEEKPKDDDEGWTEQKSNRPKKTTQDGGPSVDVEMLVNPRHYTTIIGPQGSTRQKIEDVCQVRLNLPKKGSSSEKIQISGSEDNVQRAKDAINELIDKGYSKVLDGNMDDVKMTVSNLGLLIGPSGSTIRTIQSKTGTKITLPEKGSKDDADKKNKTVTILGDTENVRAAQEAIKQLMADGFSPMTHENWCKVTLGFPANMVPILLGTKGANIRKIQDETGTRINVPDVKDKEQALIEIKVTGPNAGVEKARAAIAAVQSDFINTEMDFPAAYLPFLMGEKGANIRGLQTKTKTRIDVKEHLWDPSMRTVHIAGFIKDAEAAKLEIGQVASSNTQWRYDFPESRMFSLIGKGGSGIKKLRQTTGCRIDVKDHDWDDLVKEVVVIGPPSGVDQAKAEIEKLATPPPKPAAKAEEAPTETADAAATEETS